MRTIGRGPHDIVYLGAIAAHVSFSRDVDQVVTFRAFEVVLVKVTTVDPT